MIAWIPAGRARTMSILVPYLLMDRVIDEIWLCQNTGPGQQDDRDWMTDQAATHPRVKLKPCPGPDCVVPGMPAEWGRGYHDTIQRNTGRFPMLMTDRNTVYLRFDDDIVWVHPDMPARVVDRVLDRRADILSVHALTYNNAISSWLLQQHGRIPEEWGRVGAGANDPHQVSAVDPVGWENAAFAIRLHEVVLARIEAGTDDLLCLPAEFELGRRQQYSVSCFGISGEEYSDLNGVLTWDEEEHWLTMHRPGEVNKSNIVCGMAPVAHFSFYPQRDAILKTDILDRYRTVCERRFREWQQGVGYYERLDELAKQ